MLYEIQCDAFKDSGKTRGPIRFRQGLNVVLGSSDGANSIGKSSFLLAIDYAFGGEAYGERGDILEHVGNHEVCFSHLIDGVVHRFVRATNDPKVVWACSQGYEPTSKMTLDEFRRWLQSAYGLDGLHATFRDLVGCHIRVYGKGCLDETRPLEASSHEPMKKGITRTVKIFGEYDALADCEKRLEEAEEQRRTFAAACSRGYVASANSKSEERLNKKRISELEASSHELLESLESGLAEVDVVTSAAVVEIKDKISRLARRRTRLKGQLRRMESDVELSSFLKAKHLEELGSFFPGCNLKAIGEIEDFHKGLSKILKQEHSEARANIEVQMALIDDEIAELRKQAAGMGEISSLPTAVVNSYSNYQAEIRRLHEANDAYETGCKLSAEARDRKREAEELREFSLCRIEDAVNADLSSLSADIVGPERTAPRLTFKGGKSYEYSIWGDEGTGSGARAMVMLDLVFLKRTPLPLAVCDSVALKQVADEPLIRLLECCDQSDKQVFIAFDRAESYGGGTLPGVIQRSVVLSLSDGHELFGECWSKRGGVVAHGEKRI